ncbi:MAG: hypothetical protein V1871_01980 [Planctomycetota bacterium]
MPNNKCIKGTTFIELMMVMACLSVVAVGTYQIVLQSQISNFSMNAWNSLTQWGQSATDEINIDATQARILLQNDALGQAYLAKLQSDTTYPALSTTTLALIDSTGTLHHDTTTSRTGNALLFVKESPPFIGNAGGSTRRADIYTFVYYYLSPITCTIATKPKSLRLAKWTSIEFVDYNQVMSIPVVGSARSTFVSNLYANRGIRYLWIPRNTVSTAFYSIDATGGIAGSASAGYTIEKNEVHSVIQSLGTGIASVAWNTSAQFHTPDIVPKYANASTSGDGFPNGFEVQIIGPTSARQIMVRIVFAYYTSINQSLFSTEAFTMITTREY